MVTGPCHVKVNRSQTYNGRSVVLMRASSVYAHLRDSCPILRDYRQSSHELSTRAHMARGLRRGTDDDGEVERFLTQQNYWVLVLGTHLFPSPPPFLPLPLNGAKTNLTYRRIESQSL